MRAPALVVAATPGGGPASGREVVAYACALERAGCHTIILDGRPASAPTNDPVVLLGALAAVTSTLGLGVRVGLDSGRPASVLAKHVSAIDVCSQGRALLCIDASATCDADSGRLAEALEVVRALFRVPAPSFSGRHERLREAWNEPRWPHDHGGVPLSLLLGLGGPGYERTLELATRLSDACFLAPEPPGGDASGPATAIARPGFLEGLARAGRSAGRPPGTLPVLSWIGLDGDGAPVAQAIAELTRRAGVDGLVLDVGTHRPDPAALSSLASALS